MSSWTGVLNVIPVECNNESLREVIKVVSILDSIADCKLPLYSRINSDNDLELVWKDGERIIFLSGDEQDPGVSVDCYVGNMICRSDNYSNIETMLTEFIEVMNKL